MTPLTRDRPPASGGLPPTSHQPTSGQRPGGLPALPPAPAYCIIDQLPEVVPYWWPTGGPLWVASDIIPTPGPLRSR